MTNVSNLSVPQTPRSDWEIQAETQAARETEVFSLNKGVLFIALALVGITTVTVTFDGYGDSGQIEDVQARADDDNITIPQTQMDFAEAIWGEQEPRRSLVSLSSAIESLAYAALEQTHSGWENNDGAYGDIVFDVAAQTITLDYNERYTASENHSHIF